MERPLQIISYNTKRIDLRSLAGFILANEEQCSSRISMISDINAYAQKIAHLADILVAIEGNEIAGIVACYNNDVENRAAFISYFGVALKYRRLGVGRSLLQASIAQSVSRKMLTISLETWSENIPALSLYRSEGFVVQHVKTERGVRKAVLVKHLGPRSGA